MIKIGVIGCGKIAEKHLSAYRKIGGLKLVVSDVVERGEKIALNYKAEWCNNPDVLVRDPSIDAIDVCIPTPSHRKVVVDALRNSKYVFCEKPLARNLEEAKEIEAQARKTGRIIMVGYLYRFHPAFKFAKDIINQGIIGKPYFAIFRLGGRGSHKAWKHKRNTGGGARNEVLVHMVDLILWYFGKITKIDNLYEDTILRERKIEDRVIKADAEDTILLKIQMRQGTTVLCESDLITPSYMNYVEIHGDNGSLWFSILDDFPVMLYCKSPRGDYQQGRSKFHFPSTDLFYEELREFIECISSKKKNYLNSLEDSLEVMQILERIGRQVL
jgi:predicted dehydrogenase